MSVMVPELFTEILAVACCPVVEPANPTRLTP